MVNKKIVFEQYLVLYCAFFIIQYKPKENGQIKKVIKPNVKKKSKWDKTGDNNVKWSNVCLKQKNTQLKCKRN